MASALAPQCSANWAIKTHTLGAGQFVEFILTREWNESIVLETREWNLHFTYYWWWRWEKEKKKILIELRMRRGGVTSKKVCLSANEIQQNSNASSREEYWLYWYRFISFTFDLCGLLSFVCHSQNNSWNNNYQVDQSELLTRFRTDSTLPVWNFCCWGADVPPGETSKAARSEKKRLFSQATFYSWDKDKRLWSHRR